MQNGHQALRFALVRALPVLVSYFFISVAYGILLAQAGYHFVWALFSSVAVYAGAFQFVLATFLGAGASLATVALTALLMNSRHIFYGLSFLEEFRKMGRRCPYMVLTLTDETYSLDCALECPPELNRGDVMFWMALLSHVCWIVGSAAGAILGNILPMELEGVDFCLTALFVTIVLDQWRASRTHWPALLGFTAGILCLALLGGDRFILPALLVTSALLILFNRRFPEQKEACQ